MNTASSAKNLDWREGRGRKENWTAWINKLINDSFLLPKKEMPQGNGLSECLLNSKEEEEKVEKYFSCYFSRGKMTEYVERDNTERLGYGGMGKVNWSTFCK